MSIKEISKNKYRIEIVLGYNGDKRIRHTETFSGGKKEAELRENELKLQLKNNTFILKNKITMAELIQEWLKSVKDDIAIKTYKYYELYCENITNSIRTY